MKTKSNFKNLITNFSIVFFLLTVSSELYAQAEQNIDLKDFNIVIEKTDNGIKMKSYEGSAWSDLTFSIKSNQPQAIDEFGMTELNKNSSDKDPKLADYLFTIMNTENGIVLKGLEGTAWTDLSFKLTENERIAIDQFGMADIN